MTAVVGRAWGWLSSWGGSAKSQSSTSCTSKGQKQRSGGEGLRGWTSWIWPGWRQHGDQSSPVEEYWMAPDQIQPTKCEALGVGKKDTTTSVQVSRWWNRYLPTSYLWPSNLDLRGLTRRPCSGDALEGDADRDVSDYGTPPPSPTPSPEPTSPFRLFMDGWEVDILPEHYDICFNFLRHLFDLFVVGFLWTVSAPTKLILEVLGVQGTLRLWFHGMAMFLVSTVGMAGLLWLIQEYLPQFALFYGIIQGVVISVSVRHSLDKVKEEGEDEERNETDKIKDSTEDDEKLVSLDKGMAN